MTERGKKLQLKIWSRGVTYQDVAQAIGMRQSTFTSKLHEISPYFTEEELQRIEKFLEAL